jgi:hypothetical protein
MASRCKAWQSMGFSMAPTWEARLSPMPMVIVDMLSRPLFQSLVSFQVGSRSCSYGNGIGTRVLEGRGGDACPALPRRLIYQCAHPQQQ